MDRHERTHKHRHTYIAFAIREFEYGTFRNLRTRASPTTFSFSLNDQWISSRNFKETLLQACWVISLFCRVTLAIVADVRLLGPFNNRSVISEVRSCSPCLADEVLCIGMLNAEYNTSERFSLKPVRVSQDIAHEVLGSTLDMSPFSTDAYLSMYLELFWIIRACRQPQLQKF